MSLAKACTALVILTAFCYSFASNGVLKKYRHLKHINKNEFELAIKSENLTLVHFFQTDSKKIWKFLDAYNRAALLLENYNIPSLLVDCREEMLPDHCNEANLNKLNSFVNNESLLDMETRHMFDEDSIVSNILQLSLLDIVPVILSRDELVQVENKLKQSKDLIVGFFTAIGSREHREFIETAFTMQTVYNFTISTDVKIAQNLKMEKDNSTDALWLLKCRGAKNDSDEFTPMRCPATRMYDAINFDNLNRFLAANSLPPTVAYSNEDTDPYSDMGLHVMYLYYAPALLFDVREVGEKLAVDFMPSVGVVLIDAINDKPPKNLAYDGPIPGFGMRLRNEENVKFMEETFTYDYCRTFVHNRLFDYMRGQQREMADMTKMPDDRSLDSSLQEEVAEIEQEMAHDDCEVAQAAMAYTVNNKPDLSQLTQLTDQNFEAIFKERRVLLVLYHLQFDARSQLLLRVFANVSKLLGAKDVMAHVDCHEWKRVCDKIWITHYPQLLIHRKSHFRVAKYIGRTDPASLTEAVTLFMMDTFVELNDVDTAKKFISGQYPDALTHGPANISVLGLVDREHHAKEFREMSEELQNLGVFGLAKYGVATQL